MIYGISESHSYIDSAKLFFWRKHTEGSQKAELLGWHPDRIIKTVYLQKDDKIYGIVLPMPYKIKQKELSDVLKISKREAASLKFATTYPYMQMPHSMTPFIAQQDIILVEKILFADITFGDIVDFSYPGRSDISIHMKYEEAISILMQRYEHTIIKWPCSLEARASDC